VSIDVRGGAHLDSTIDDNFARIQFNYPSTGGPLPVPGPGITSVPFHFTTVFHTQTRHANRPGR
jgi:hypothetical protein